MFVLWACHRPHHPAVFLAQVSRPSRHSQCPTLETDHDPDDLVPRLPSWAVVRDLESADPTQETRATVDDANYTIRLPPGNNMS